MYDKNDVFVIVLARDHNGVAEKHEELKRLGLTHVIVCGERGNSRSVIFRTPRGKYDAINCAIEAIPRKSRIIVLNDVDTSIVNFDLGLANFSDPEMGFACTRVVVPQGPPSKFNDLIDGIRRRFIIAANGELIFIRREVFELITPLPPCKAEDTFMLFQTMRFGYKVHFETQCYVFTTRTTGASLKKEELFKRKAVCGIYQAISLTKAPLSRKLFYAILPFASPLLLVAGKSGFYWMRGIILGVVDFLKGDRTGFWLPDYK